MKLANKRGNEVGPEIVEEVEGDNVNVVSNTQLKVDTEFFLLLSIFICCVSCIWNASHLAEGSTGDLCRMTPSRACVFFWRRTALIWSL